MAADPDEALLKWRAQIVQPSACRVLIANLRGTPQERDLSKPTNCQGHGRVHHFRRWSSDTWPENPLPMNPACKALGMPRVDLLRVQIFQCAACNFRCWYCFVPPELLTADAEHSSWLNCQELLDLYLEQPEPPSVIDLSGGNPGLVPEWVVWMIRAVKDRGLSSQIYLWADDNLSTDFFWRFLSDAERELLATYRNHGRVGCFKGFDHESFAFNTGADSSLFDRQFAVMRELLRTGTDTYGYVTLATPILRQTDSAIARFVDNLQTVDENLPLRTVPLEIKCFTPTKARLNPAREAALRNQYAVVDCWCAELEKRYPSGLRTLSIADVPLQGGKPRGN